jgi:hypothetical protein
LTALFQQKADLPLHFVPDLKPASKVAVSDEVVDGAFCNRLNDHFPPLTHYLKEFVNKVKVRHTFALHYRRTNFVARNCKPYPRTVCSPFGAAGMGALEVLAYGTVP